MSFTTVLMTGTISTPTAESTRVRLSASECILGTIELCSVGSNCFVVDDCDHTILTQLVAESQRFRREQRVSARSRAANVRIAELQRRNEGYEW